MSDHGAERFGFDDVDHLVERAVQAAGSFARRGSTLTTGVAIIAAVATGSAYLLGLAAFDGGARTTWAGLGAILLIAAVGAPLLASFRLRSIPRRSAAIAGELRTLLGRSDEAKRVVIDTVEADEGARATMPSGRPVPAVVFQSQHYTRLRALTGVSGEFKSLAIALQSLASLPGLVIVGLILTGVGAFLSFVFFLIWIF